MFSKIIDYFWAKKKIAIKPFAWMPGTKPGYSNFECCNYREQILLNDEVVLALVTCPKCKRKKVIKHRGLND